jgi:membrane associated rhomboid family serine protease
MYQRYNRPVWQDPIFVLIGINVLVYVLTLGSTEIGSRLGLFNPTFTSEPWTAITSLFVHAGLFHLFGNMLTLYFFGSYLIQIVGERTMLAIYFIGGIVGSLFFWLLGPDGGFAVGASGAVLAVGGALAVLRPNTKVLVFPIPVPVPLWVAVVGGGIVLSVIIPNIAWEAHLGGMLTGMAAALLISRGKLRF